MQRASALSAPPSGVPANAGIRGEGFGERGCSGKDGRRVWAPESRVGWRTGRERPDAHLWVTLGSHRAAEEGPRGLPCVPGAPAPGTRESCREAEGPGSAVPPPLFVHSPAGARGPGHPQPRDPLPPLPAASPTSAPGSGVRKTASSRAPPRTGSGRSASTSSITSAARSSRRRLPGSPTPRPGLGAPPPACCTPRGPPGGGGAGARRAERRAEWAAPPSGAPRSLRPAPAPPGKPASQTRFQTAITGGSFKTPHIQATHSL